MSTDGTPLYLENQLCFPLYAASRLTTKIYAPLLKNLDITYPQYLVLLVLWQHGNQSVQAICNRLLLETNTVTPLLKRLEEKKIISRKRMLKDERVVEISLTYKVSKLQKKAIEILDRIANSFKDKFIIKKEIINLQESVIKLIDIMNKKISYDG